MFTAPASAKPLRPERVLSSSDNVSMVEVVQQLGDGSTRVAGYRVYGDGGEPSVLHESRQEAEIDFLRRTWR